MGMIDALGRVSLRAWGLAFALILVFLLVWFFWGSQEGRLHRQLDRIEETANLMAAANGGVMALAQAQSFSDFFSQAGVHIIWDGGRVLKKNPLQIRQMALLWAQHGKGGSLALSKRSHTIGDGTASSKVWVELMTPAGNTGYEKGGWVILQWQEEDGEWKIAQATAVEP